MLAAYVTANMSSDCTMKHTFCVLAGKLPE